MENEIKKTTEKKCPYCGCPDVIRSGQVLSSGIDPNGKFYIDTYNNDVYECTKCKKEFYYILENG